MIVGLQLAVLYLAPCAAILLLLWAGRYPGEQLIERLRRWRHRPRRHAPRALVARVARARDERAGAAHLAGSVTRRGPPATRRTPIENPRHVKEPMNHKNLLLPGALIGALALPAAAGAHVTLQPNAAAAGSYTVLSVRVPNERDNAATTKVTVRMPHGFADARYQATPGWTVAIAKRKLAQPIQTDDGPLTEEVSQITWTANAKAAAIEPGQFRDFPLSVQIPGKDGDKLTFKALQTYGDGQVVRWIGAPGSDTPAPQVSVGAASGAHGATTPAADVQPVAAATTASDSGGASKGLAIAALIAGLAGILLGGAALLRRRA